MGGWGGVCHLGWLIWDFCLENCFFFLGFCFISICEAAFSSMNDQTRTNLSWNEH